MRPDLAEAERVFAICAASRPAKFILLSSAMIYGAFPGRQSQVKEEYSALSPGTRGICRAWKALEGGANQKLAERTALTILRPVTVIPWAGLLGRRLLNPLVFPSPGHNPVMQFLSLEDLGRAVLCAMESDRTGVFNVAPVSVVPLRAAIRAAGKRSVPLPRTLQRCARNSESLEYMRYPWTVSNAKAKAELGFEPRKTSVAVLRGEENGGDSSGRAEPEFDEFGMDPTYIRARGKTIFKFLSERYWRIETRGIKSVPQEGPGVLVGMHRGFMPWDAVMVLHLIEQETGRIPRFLTHPGLFKFPFIADFVTRMGGVIACQESADRILQRGELLGVFPEGVQGAFSRYREAYRLQGFRRYDFVKMALRHRAPIVPFVTVGSAEALPVFRQIRSRWWTRYTDWPCIPVSTFPIVPVPLPTKWHIRFLPPIRLEEKHFRDKAREDSGLDEIGEQVRTRMQQAVGELIRRRRSIFFGSVFDPEEK